MTTKHILQPEGAGGGLNGPATRLLVSDPHWPSPHFSAAADSRCFITQSSFETIHSRRAKRRWYEDFRGSEAEAYAAAARIARELGCTALVALGCGQGSLLAQFYPEFEIVGVDDGPHVQFCSSRYPFGLWLEADVAACEPLALPASVLSRAVVIYADVLRRTRNPLDLVGLLKWVTRHAQAVVLSVTDASFTPARTGGSHLGKPDLLQQLRATDFRSLLREHGLSVSCISSASK